MLTSVKEEASFPGFIERLRREVAMLGDPLGTPFGVVPAVGH
ncbi:MAG TPA: hypothetical protein VG125_01770 [Pirellulales bacterium]|jgi:hypothetical protein|nr:hypothetical protein [Pirellulales bacterium]